MYIECKSLILVISVFIGLMIDQEYEESKMDLEKLKLSIWKRMQDSLEDVNLCIQERIIKQRP